MIFILSIKSSESIGHVAIQTILIIFDFIKIDSFGQKCVIFNVQKIHRIENRVVYAAAIPGYLPIVYMTDMNGSYFMTFNA